MSTFQMYDFPETPDTLAASGKDTQRAERDLTLSIIIAGLQRVVRGEHSHDEQERIIRNAAMLLADLGTQH